MLQELCAKWNTYSSNHRKFENNVILVSDGISTVGDQIKMMNTEMKSLSGLKQIADQLQVHLIFSILAYHFLNVIVCTLYSLM